MNPCRAISLGLCLLSWQQVLAFSSFDPVEFPSGIPDVYLNTLETSPSLALQGESNFCFSVQASCCSALNSANNIDVSLSGNNNGSDFLLTHDVTSDTLAVDVLFQTDYDPVWESLPASGSQVRIDSNFSDRADNCSKQSAQGHIRAEVSNSDLGSATAGTYTGNFTFYAENAADPVFSNDTTSVTVYVPELIRLSGLNDLNLGTFDGTNDMVDDDEFCVFFNGYAKNYKLTGSGGAGASDAYELDDGSGNKLPYQVAFRTSDIGSYQDRATGVSLTGLQGSGALDCSDGQMAYVQVTVSSASALSAVKGTFTGTLYITAEPE